MQISAQLAGEASVANADPSSSRCMRTGSLAVLGQMQTWRTRARTARTGSARLTNGMAVRKHLSYSRARTRQALAQVLERLNRDQTQSVARWTAIRRNAWRLGSASPRPSAPIGSRCAWSRTPRDLLTLGAPSAAWPLLGPPGRTRE